MLDGWGQGELVIYTAYLLTGLSTFFVARFLLEEQESRAVEESLEESQGGKRASNWLVNFTRPFFTQYVVPVVRGKPFWDNRRQIYKRKLVTAGLNRELTPDQFISYKFFLIVFFPLVLGMMNALGLIDLAWPYVLLSGVVGWFYPDFWTAQRIRNRQKEIRRSMPFVVDLLALSTEAGLDFVNAIGRVVEKSAPGPLLDEFEQLLREIQVGSSRQDAMREMSLRIDMPEMSSFIAILISADQMGASIGKVLRQQSDQIRSERFVAAEKAGAAASQKIILPLVLFIMPAVFLMILGPWALSFLGLDN